jgi:phenylacetate-CoA ligase
MAHYLEKIYPFVPVAIQNLGISLYGLAWRQERLGGYFDKYAEGFRMRGCWTAERIQKYTERELRRVLIQAFDEVPYYQKTWISAGIKRRELERMTIAELPRLPITPKSDLRVDPHAFVRSSAWKGNKLYRYHSSGSTGTPITSICSADDHRRFIAAREARSFNWAGTTIRGSRAMIGGRIVVPKGVSRPPFHRYNWAEQQVYLSAYHISPVHLRHYVNAFTAHQPRLLTGYANSYYLLARMMNEQGIRLNYTPDALVLSSEKLTPEMKTTIRQAFRARAYEEYGAVENCVLATECEQGNLHVSPDFGVMEIVDDEGNPVPPGKEGRILCTSLLNETQPLIRYEIGDLGVWSTANCTCGRDHLPMLKEIVGRLEDVVVGPDGREMVRFHWMFIDMPTVVEGQVIQEDLDRFTVKVVGTSGFSAVDEALIRNRFAERLGPVKVAVEKVSEIPRTERGKFRAVISKVKPAQSRQLEAQTREMSVTV